MECQVGDIVGDIVEDIKYGSIFLVVADNGDTLSWMSENGIVSRSTKQGAPTPPETWIIYRIIDRHNWTIKKLSIIQTTHFLILLSNASGE